MHEVSACLKFKINLNMRTLAVEVQWVASRVNLTTGALPCLCGDGVKKRRWDKV